ncbi:MAG TPA: alpha-L-fucosidase [Micromonosporaceae bacterium]|nr:alpha-L-fucosidase [Micromonosporaceae bacterium]
MPDADVPWQRLQRPVPTWFTEAGLGIFIHWGAYSVPAWGEPVGELGTVDDATWFQHNPYAEWYWNTIRLSGSPASQRHREMYGDATYDDFLDSWTASQFDAADWLSLFARAGARYVVPTTKHHDGIALWDAPGTGTRNTVRRGPRRDLVGELAAATREAGLRFGVYYSGGLDWSVTDLPPIRTQPDVVGLRPRDAAYAAYAALQVRDLIDRYRPDMLWNDIEWPDAGKHDGELGLFQLFEQYYATVPEGVVNDRWGETHWDFRTSEYQHGLANESAAAWENCRGIGLSFGYNQAEDEAHSLDGPGVVRHLVDVVSRGGNLLLNVGPTADGRIPDVQRWALEGLAGWMQVNAAAVHGVRPVEDGLAAAGADPWVRWTTREGELWAACEGTGRLLLPADPSRLDLGSARLADGTPVAAERADGGVVVDLPVPAVPGPAVVRFTRAGT